MKKNRLLCLLLCVILTVTALAYPVKNVDRVDAASKGLEITMLDVHQGLSILVKADGKYMLFDGGGRDRSAYVVSYLQGKGIKTFQYVVASHYDEDHIAGLVGVLNKFKVKKCLCPSYKKDTKIYKSFQKKLKANGAEVIHPKCKSKYKLGDATIRVLAPKSYTSGSDNDRSIAVRITYGDFKCVITGDAEKDSEAAMVDSGQALACNLYIAGHHGSRSSSSTKFLNKLKAKYVYVSCGKGNSYGHPHKETLNRFKKKDMKMYRSDLQGEVTMKYNGEKIKFSKSASKNWKSGDQLVKEEETEKPTVPETDQPSVEYKYVVNKNSLKFHYPTCSGVANMKEENKLFTNENREILINEGYSPCGTCKP